jgi:cell division inhibitor SulA/protein ImuA
MKLITCQGGRLLTLSVMLGDGPQVVPPCADIPSFTTGLAAFDALAPGGVLRRGAVHEILSDPSHGTPLFFAMLLARSCGATSGAIIWCNPDHELYPPALAAQGIDLDRLFLLQPKTPAEQTWAVAECLKCRGVAAVVAAMKPAHRLSRLEARRLQLSAERGGGVALLLRPSGKASAEHAAATRWLVRPAPGERTVQRWEVQLVHGHGGRVGQTVILEHSRETNRVRAAEKLADRRRPAPAGAETA